MKQVLILLFLVASIQLKAQDSLLSVKVSKVPDRDLNAPEWDKAKAVTVALNAQNIITPTLKSASITDLKVKSIHDGEKIAFLIEWTDSTRDALVDVHKFCDQLAIQFPIDPASYPSFMMGNKNGRVHIIHWKALWQDDIEKGYRDVITSHPNYWVDLYYFKDKNQDSLKFANASTVKDFTSPEGKNYMHGAYAGNPMSIFDRKNPSEEAIAEGFGTLTTQPVQNATAWGAWEKNKWKVVIVRLLKSPDTSDAMLSNQGMAGFAVWDGNKRNIGARKHYSNWINFKIEK